MKSIFIYLILAGSAFILLPWMADAAGISPRQCPAGQVFDADTTRCISDKTLRMREPSRIRIGNEPGAEAIDAAAGTFESGGVTEDDGSTATTSGGSTLGQSAGNRMDGTITTF